MINAKFHTSESLTRFLNTRLRGFDVEVGILENKPAAKWKHQQAGQLAGGPRNRQGGSNKEVSLQALMDKFNTAFNILLAPWRKESNKDIVLLIREMVRNLANKSDRRRFLNTAQAVVRNPISRGEYGKNSAAWAHIKGFNRLMINTGRFFTAIRARFK